MRIEDGENVKISLVFNGENVKFVPFYGGGCVKTLIFAMLYSSGSLMGINYREIESNSVGYKEDYEMHSMDFEEFLWAKRRNWKFLSIFVNPSIHGNVEPMRI